MHVQPVREGNRRTVADVGFDVVAIDVGLKFIGRRHHHQVGPSGGFSNRQHLETISFGLLGRCRTCPQGNRHVFRA